MSAVRRLRLIDSSDDAPGEGGAIRVAVATQDLKMLDAHFGSARHFAVYEVRTSGWTLVETISFDEVSDQQGVHTKDGKEGDDRIAPKVEALAGVHLLFCLAIGGPSAARVVQAKIHPIKVPSAQPIEAVLERTRAMLEGAPPPWLRKVLAEAGAGPAKPSFVDDE